MPGDRPLWPAVPPLICGEAFGSWFGRIAARYRVDVDVLATCAQLELDLGSDARRWLAAPPPQGTSAAKLAELTGTPAQDIEATNGDADCQSRTFRYCFTCLVLNPQDVFSPYWKGQWLDRDWARCDVHLAPAEALTESGLRGHKNMRKLLQMAGRRHRETISGTIWSTRHQMYASRVR